MPAVLVHCLRGDADAQSAKVHAGNDRHQQAPLSRPCQYMSQPRYRVVASCTADATIPEFRKRFAATWCSNPFSQM